MAGGSTQRTYHGTARRRKFLSRFLDSLQARVCVPFIHFECSSSECITIMTFQNLKILGTKFVGQHFYKTAPSPSLGWKTFYMMTIILAMSLKARLLLLVSNCIASLRSDLSETGLQDRLFVFHTQLTEK